MSSVWLGLEAGPQTNRTGPPATRQAWLLPRTCMLWYRYLLPLPQVFLTGTECLLRLGLAQGTQGTAHLLLYQRVLVGDGIQQDDGQFCSNRAGALRPSSTPQSQC